MSSADIWGILKHTPFLAAKPWHYPISVEFCKCKRHVKFFGVTNPSKWLRAIWTTIFTIHLFVNVSLFGILITELNLKKPSLSIAQIVFYCLIATVTAGVATPSFTIAYLIRDGSTLTQLMILESRLMNKHREKFSCKFVTFLFSIIFINLTCFWCFIIDNRF